MTNYKMME